MKYEYWFANIKGISAKRKVEIREKLEQIQDLYFCSEYQMKMMGLSEMERSAIIESIRNWKLSEAYEIVLKNNVRCIPIKHPEYPANLKEISAPPYMLYVKGKMPNLHKYTIAIVGARQCSCYGEIMTRKYAEVLAERGVQIVSGMARGIDSIAQSSALAAGGTSFAVLGSGVDYCYPQELFGLYRDLINQGGVISEYPVSTKPLKQHFPARNRIISGLADLVLVMEAKEKSGSLITVDMALEQGKEVYALPGPADSMLSRGCHSLIKQGAGILISPEELITELGVLCENNIQNSPSEKILLETTENLVYSCLNLQPQNINELVRKTGMPIPVLLDILVRLELSGLIKEFSKNNYVKLK